MALEPIQSPIKRVQCSFPGMKRLEYEADCSQLSDADVNVKINISAFACACMAWY
jgi:hypothetical protein